MTNTTEVKIISKKTTTSVDNALSAKNVAHASNKSYGTGRRKNAVARVWVSLGSGKITVNKKPADQYFTREALIKSILQPFYATNTVNQYDIFCTVKGGGCSGQAGAILHGVARALDKIAPDLHTKLRHGGFLTRDSRVVERKKFGQHKARKSTQFSKR